MSFDFPKLLENSPNNVIFGPDFDLMKREPIHNMFIGYNQVSLFDGCFVDDFFSSKILESFQIQQQRSIHSIAKRNNNGILTKDVSRYV